MFFYTVPDSPDLSMHVRSLQKPATPDHSDYSQRLSLSSEHGDQVLEDTGTVGATCKTKVMIVEAWLPAPKC